MRDELRGNFSGLRTIDQLPSAIEAEREPLANDVSEFIGRKNEFLDKLYASKQGETDLDFLASNPPVRLLQLIDEELQLHERVKAYLQKLPAAFDEIVATAEAGRAKFISEKRQEYIERGMSEREANALTRLHDVPAEFRIGDDFVRSQTRMVHNASTENRSSRDAITKRAERVRSKLIGAAL